MFGGPGFITESLTRKSALPAVTLKQMERLQAKIDDGEECYPANGMQRG